MWVMLEWGGGNEWIDEAGTTNMETGRMGARMGSRQVNEVGGGRGREM